MNTQLQKKSVLLMILLAIITYAIYVPVWFLNRKDAFNALNTKEKLNGGLIIFLLVLYILSAVILIPSLLFAETNLGAALDSIDSLISLVGVIITLILSFKVRRMISEHYNTPLSGVATFFFTLFYLQYKINRLTEVKTDVVPPVPPPPPAPPQS